jgi:hypothetical protein
VPQGGLGSWANVAAEEVQAADIADVAPTQAAALAERLLVEVEAAGGLTHRGLSRGA